MAHPPDKHKEISFRAYVHPKAVLGKKVSLGPGVVIGPEVVIGDECFIGPFAVIEGRTKTGSKNRICTGVCLGVPPQHLTDQGENTELIIGDGNTIREYVTVSRGSVGGGGLTRIGHDNLIMTNVHIAHDVTIGNGVVITHGSGVGGRATIEDKAIIGGLSGIHQYARVGCMAMVGAGSIVRRDIPPYFLAAGNPARPFGVNRVGLTRNGLDEKKRALISKAYKVIYRSNFNLSQALEVLKEDFSDIDEVQHIVRFIEESTRGIAR
jgi:UDP-N-acetylglucosamine acyltransferase